MKENSGGKILLAHGSGGKLMHQLIRKLLLKKLNNPILAELSDSARLSCKGAIAFTTDSFVVSPLFFPGGDIGKLCVCGTANDLAVAGAVPEYLSLGLIIEEGLDYKILEKIVSSIALEAKKAGLSVVAGDLKVVESGACDKIFINTSGVGRLIRKEKLALKNIQPGDKIIVSGPIGAHGMSVLAKRKEMGLGFNIKSDCAALNDLIVPAVKKFPAIKFMRDPTRGGLGTTLNEIAQGAKVGIIINEKDIPVSSKVKSACELLGIDPLFSANEGVAVIVAAALGAEELVKFLRRHPLGRQAKIIGEVLREPAGRLVLNTIFNTRRFVDMLVSEPLPRIC